MGINLGFLKKKNNKEEEKKKIAEIEVEEGIEIREDVEEEVEEKKEEKGKIKNKLSGLLLFGLKKKKKERTEEKEEEKVKETEEEVEDKVKETEEEVEDKSEEGYEGEEEIEKEREKEEKSSFWSKLFRKKESVEIKLKDDIIGEIESLNIPETIKSNWINLYERFKDIDWDKELQDIINHFKLNYDLEGLKRGATQYGLPPLVFLVEIARLVSWDEIIPYWEEKYQIRYDNLFTTHDYVFEIANNPKRIAEFLVGEGQLANKELGLYSPLDVKLLIPKLVLAVKYKNEYGLDSNLIPEDFKKLYRYSEGKIVLVNPQLFERKETYKVKAKVEKKEEISKTKEVRQKFMRLIKDAISLGVSDIHFSPKKNWVEVKVRLFGDLTLFQYLSHPEWQAMMRVIKTMAAESGSTIEVDEWRKEQDAKLTAEYGVDLRLAFTPSLIEKEQYLVCRILYKGKSIKVETGKEAEVIKKLGYFDEDAQYLKNYLMTKEKGQGGILIMSGATGSGKSATLNSMLALIPPTRAIKTIEDPVEYRLENADQHEVLEFIKEDKPTKFGFLEAIREFMRQDPDIIFVGEWRKNPELTGGITYASKTGHFVLTTLHSSRVINIPDLLLSDYEVDQPTQANTLSLLISQRLLKTVCPNCALIDEVGYFQLKEIVEKMQFLDRERIFELLDAFENPNVKIYLGDIELTKKQRIPLETFVKALINDEVKVVIPEFLKEKPKTFKEYRDKKWIHKIENIEEYSEKITKMIDTALTLLEQWASERRKALKEDRKPNLSKEEEEFLRFYELSKEEDETGIYINTEKFLKIFLFPLIREKFKSDLMMLRERVKYLTPKINPEGCEICIKHNPQTGAKVSAGVKGRTPIYELLFCDTEVKELIFNTTEALEVEKMLLKKNKEYFTNEDLSLTPKGRSFVDTFVRKLKENYKWAIPFSEIQKLL